MQATAEGLSRRFACSVPEIQIIHQRQLWRATMRRSLVVAIEKDDEETFELMKKTDFDACKTRFKSVNNKLDEERKVLNDFLTVAKDEKKLHLPAFKAAMSIMKKEEPGRGEYLFHLGHYLKWLGALDQPDMLPDRAGDGEKDLRPPSLRRTEAEREISEAADKAKQPKDEKLGEDGKPLN